MKRLFTLIAVTTLTLAACSDYAGDGMVMGPTLDPMLQGAADHAGLPTSQHSVGIVLLTPVNTIPASIQIVWHKSPITPNNYHAQVFENATCTGNSPIYNNAQLAGTAHTLLNHLYVEPGNALGVGSYCVQVKGQGLTGQNPFKEFVQATIVIAPAPPVNNPPTAGFTYDPAAPDEGQQVDFTGTANDPDGDALTYEWKVDGVLVSTSLSMSRTFNDNGTYDVSFKASDGKGGTATETQYVDVANVAPTATFNAADVNEGDDIDLSLTGVYDPSSADVSAGFQYAFDCGDGAGYGAWGSSNTASCPTTNEGVRTVGGKVRDKDGGESEYTQSVTVHDVNQPPTASFTYDPANPDEGEQVDFTGLASDPDGDPLTYEWKVDGVQVSTSLSFSHTFDDNGTYAVSFTASDGKGGTATDMQDVVVANVAPTATFNTADVNEGTDIDLSLTGVQDPSSADVSAGFQYAFDCGDGGGYGAWGSSSTVSCPTTDNGVRTVGGKVRDKDGGESEYTQSVTVSNVAPTATFNTGDVAEGTNISLSLTGVSDPSSADVLAGFQYAFDCGSGYGAWGSSSTASCPTTDDDVRTVGGKVRDKDGGQNEYTQSVTVSNVAPDIQTFNVSSYGPLPITAVVNVSGTFTDPGSGDTHSLTLACGGGVASGQAAAFTTAPNGNYSGTCTYAAAGIYTIMVTLTDDDGGYDEATSDFVIVYDPNGGFVTGGGWIDSPANACHLHAACLGLTGRANFGFVSKYQKGAAVPTGNTQFHFNAGNFQFQSTSYQWLVVSGAKAQYKGYGNVNGVAGYGFILTAIDGQLNGGGGVDKFRIKVWDVASGAVVYDNQLGQDELGNAATAIGGGSIVIHTGGKK